MTYIVSSGALNSTHSLTPDKHTCGLPSLHVWISVTWLPLDFGSLILTCAYLKPLTTPYLIKSVFSMSSFSHSTKLKPIIIFIPLIYSHDLTLVLTITAISYFTSAVQARFHLIVPAIITTRMPTSAGFQQFQYCARKRQDQSRQPSLQTTYYRRNLESSTPPALTVAYTCTTTKKNT